MTATKTLEVEIMGQAFLLNAIDLDDILDYSFVVKAAVEVALKAAADNFPELMQAAASEDAIAGARSGLELASNVGRCFTPELMKALRPKVMAKALLKGPPPMPVERALRDGLLVGGLSQAQAVFMYGIGLSFGPFGGGGTGEFLKATGALLFTSTQPFAGAGPSGASGPTG